MLILHDPTTLAHKTIELLGAKLVPALESPERISAILKSLEASNGHEIETINVTRDSRSGAELLHVLTSTHDAGYLHHLEHAHASWLKEGLIEPHESVLPECFLFPTVTRNGHEGDPCPGPPKDIFARAGFYAFDMSTGICASTWPSVLASANLAFRGVKALCPPPPPSPPDQAPPRSTTLPTVLALCRPPGHHCDTRRAGGYCYLNNAVVAVETFRLHYSPPSTTTTLSLSPSPSPPPHIAILDLDFHHGNGTQEAFYADPSVLYISIHGEDEYPYYTGAASETGASNARHTNINLPLPARSSAQQYLQKLAIGLGALVDFAPDFVVLSLGFDTFHLDPLGSFTIETEDYAKIAGRVRETLESLQRERDGDTSSAAGVPCLILLEGGYVIESLGPNMLSFLKGWEEV